MYSGKTIPLATEQLSTQEVADKFYEVLNKKIESKILPVLIRRLFLGKNFYKMFKWMTKITSFQNEAVDLTKKEFPNPLSLKTWIERYFQS